VFFHSLNFRIIQHNVIGFIAGSNHKVLKKRPFRDVGLNNKLERIHKID